LIKRFQHHMYIPWTGTKHYNSMILTGILDQSIHLTAYRYAPSCAVDTYNLSL